VPQVATLLPDLELPRILQALTTRTRSTRSTQELTQTVMDQPPMVVTEPTRKQLPDRGLIGHKDVHDAAQIPPSVFAAHHGEPEILHNDLTHDRARRHSIVSHQEQHSGI